MTQNFSHNNPLFQQLIEAIRTAICTNAKTVALHEPHLCGKEWEYIKDCLDSGWISSVGKYVDLFEENLAQYTGMKRAVSTVNGTAALQVCCRLVGVESGDEVLLPSLTFVATANAVHYSGGIPHFVDCDENTLGVSPSVLRTYLRENTELRSGNCFNKKTGRRIRALIAVHVFGHPVDLDALMQICSDFKIEFIEDATESLGSQYKGRHAGTYGKVSVLSFNGNKIISTGGGGAILTNDTTLADQAKHLTTTAKQKHPWRYFHDQIGYNFRLPNINAALGCAQLEQIDFFVSKKRALAERYKMAFSKVAGVKFFKEPPFAKSNYWLNAFLFDTPDQIRNDAFLEYAHHCGLMLRPAWTLMHRLPMYKTCPRADLSVSENIEARLINLPSSSQLGRFC
ncbi:MAG: LegC family aminotransferase [Deltaproteobacteria bacterium]|nr:LegC family aminotransferase [Deltaproteobacteria bacterium]